MASSDDSSARRQSAREIIKKYSLGTATTGLLPLPLVDLVALSVMQRKMLRALTELYGVEYSEQRLKFYVGALLSDVSSISMAGGAGVLLGSLLKVMPGVGTLAGASLMPAATGASTYALGKVFVRHFESGGNLLDFDPKKMRGYFEEQLAEAAAETRGN